MSIRLPAIALASILMALAACGSKDPGGADGGTSLLIVVNAPFSENSSLGETIANGVQLAVDQINESGGIETPTGTFRLRVQRMDNALSPQKALDNVRRAVELGAVAVVDEGTGVDASWQVAADADLPICITYQGGAGLVDPDTRPNVFRIAPTDHGMAFRLAEYIIPKGLKVALLHDDTGYGQEGYEEISQAFGSNPEAVAADLTVPSTGSDVSPQILEARNAGATALLVWARASTLAEVIRAARSTGWDVPIYAPASGEDPLVRQQLSDHPEWVDGLVFASGRMTAERGPAPYLEFQDAYEEAFGPDEVGVENSTGETVVQPPDYGMYPYDFVNVLAATIKAANGSDPAKVLDALNQVDVQGANGDERGFNENNHEGVVDDDVYFAVFEDMTFTPVEDDPLSSTLDVIDQTR